MGLVRNNQFIEIGSSANITIDNSLSSNSNNPVKNSAIYNKFDEISQEYNALSSVVNNLGSTRLMPIAGLVTEPYDLKQQGYAGEDGEIFIDEANERIVLLVEKNIRSYYGYTVWNNAGGRYSNLNYDLHNQFFWYVDENSNLHIGRYLNHQFVEVIGNDQIVVDSTLNSQSSNPVKNSTLVHALDDKQDVLIPGENIKTINGEPLIGSGNIEISASSARQATIIHYYGDNPQNKSGRWHAGEVFFDTENNTLYECSQDYDLPDTEIPLTEGFYYVIEPTPKFLYHNSELSGTDETGYFIPVVEVDSDVNENSVNPLENGVIAKQLKGLYDMIKRYHPEEEPTPSDDPTDPGDPGTYSNVFDSTIGNWGELNVNTTIDGEVVNLKNNVEKITPELMEAAWDKLNVDYLSDGVTLIEDIADIANLSEGEKFMITGEAAGFQSGTEDPVKTNNETVLINILKAPAEDNIFSNCIGVKLDQVYYVRGGQSDSASKCTFYIEKDFVIDGGDSDNANEAIGGFRFSGLSTNIRYYPRCFYTSHSLNLKNVLFYQEKKNTSRAFFTIDYADFISQIQVVGCEFIGLDESIGGCVFDFTPKSWTSPFEEGSNSYLINSNAIDYVLFKNNDFSNAHVDGSINSNVGIRVNKGFLITENTFKKAGIYIAKNAPNVIDPATGKVDTVTTALHTKIGSELGYVSCPLFIVNNNFTGYDTIHRPATSTSYCTPIMTNYQSVYVLHNTISNYISGRNNSGNFAGVYDMYSNSSLVYFCNNHVHNLIRFTIECFDFGSVKAKGSGITYRFRPDKGTGLYVSPIRYYVGNTYDVDKSEVLAYWNNRASDYPNYPGRKEGDDRILDNNGNLIEEHVFYFSVGGYIDDYIKTTVFSGNTIKYPYVKPGSHWTSEIIEICNNVYTYEENGVALPARLIQVDSGYMTSFQMFCAAVSGRIDIIGNTFNFDNPVIDLLYLSNPGGVTAPTYLLSRNINVYDNVLYNHNVLRYRIVRDPGYQIFSNKRNQEAIPATYLPTNDIVPLSDSTDTLQPNSIPLGGTINVNNNIYRRTAGEYVTNFFWFMSDVSTNTFEDLVFNNVTYTLKLTATESINVTINGPVANLSQFRDIFVKALWDNGYTANRYDYNDKTPAIYVLSNSCGVCAWQRGIVYPPVNTDQSSNGKPKIKVFSITPNIVLESSNYIAFNDGDKTKGIIANTGVAPLYDGENATWTKISEGDNPIPIGPTLPTVDTYDDLPLSANVGDQVIVEGGTEAGTYECEEEGTPCTVNFAFRTKASDNTLGVACTFNNETFNIPFYEDVSISLTLNGSLTPEQIRDAFVSAACTQLGLNASNEKEVYTKASPTYQIYYAQLGAKSNGESVWYNTGNSVIGSSSEFNNNKRQQLILHSDYPRANVQSANASISRYSLSAGSRPTWKKID